MTQVPFQPRVRLLLATLVLQALATAGCGTANHRTAYDASATVERPVAMKGSESFFDGQVEATMTVSRGFGRNMGGGGTGRRGHRDDEAPDLSEVFSSELSDTSEDKNYEAVYEKMKALQVRGSPLPPVVLRLFLQSHAKEAMQIEILEVNSDLGNFAVRPEKLSVAAEKMGEPDPMNSLMGVTSDEIPVKVVLRIAGKTDTKQILVKSLFTPDGKKK